MAHARISQEQVLRASQQLDGRGEQVTISTVWKELGSTGSRTTIKRHLNHLAAVPSKITPARTTRLQVRDLSTRGSLIHQLHLAAKGFTPPSTRIRLELTHDGAPGRVFHLVKALPEGHSATTNKTSSRSVAPKVTKEEVRMARARVLAHGDHPSSNAVRAELGNHHPRNSVYRMLQEIAIEEFPDARVTNPQISNAIGNLVSALAVQLRIEAQEAAAAKVLPTYREYRKHLEWACLRIEELQKRCAELSVEAELAQARATAAERIAEQLRNSRADS